MADERQRSQHRGRESRLIRLTTDAYIRNFTPCLSCQYRMFARESAFRYRHPVSWTRMGYAA